MNNDPFSNVTWKSFKGAGSSYASGLSRMMKDDEERRQREEAARYAREETQRQIEAGVLNSDGSEKTPQNAFQKVGSFLRSAPGALVEGTMNTYNTAGRIGGDLAAEFSGENKKIEDNLKSIADSDYEMLNLAINKSKDLRLSEEERQRWSAVKEEYSSKWSESTKAVSEYYDEKTERYDPVKAGTAIAEVGLDVVTAGTAGASIRGGRAAVKTGQLATKGNQAKNVAEAAKAGRVVGQGTADNVITRSADRLINPVGIKQSMGSGAVLGVGYGMTGTGVELGQQATAGDFAQGAGTGLLLGGALGGSVSLLGSAGRKVFSGMKDRSKDTQGAVAELLKEAPEEAISAPGFTDRINELAESSTNVGDLKVKYNQFLNELKGEAGDATTTARTAEPLPESRQLGPGVRDASEVDADIAKLQAGEDDSVYRMVASDGTDVTDTAKYFDNQIKSVDRDIKKLRAQKRDLDMQAEGKDLTGEARAPEGVDPSEYTGDVQGRTRAGEGSSNIDAQIEELEARKTEIQNQQSTAFEQLGGVQRVQDPTLVREKFSKLQSERAAVDAYRETVASNKNSDSIQREIDDLDRGVVPDDVVNELPPAQTAEEAVARSIKKDPTDQVGVQSIYNDVQTQRLDAEDELSRLVTVSRYERYMADLNENYRLKKEEIDQLPGPQQKEEMILLDDDYSSQMMDMRSHMESDAPRVRELEEAIALSDNVNQNILDEWNSVEQSNPTLFGDVDERALELYRDSLVKARSQKLLEEASEGRPVTAVERQDSVAEVTSTSNTKNQVSKQLDDNPDLGDAAHEQFADALTSGNTDVTLLDEIMRYPRTVFAKWGTAGKAVLDAVDDAQYNMNKFNGNLQARYKKKSWGTAMKESYMDDTVDFLNDGKALTRKDFEPEAHFKKRQEAANDMKAWFRSTGRKLGLPEDVVMRDYLPHIIENRTKGLNMDRAAEALAMLRSGKNANGQDLTAGQRKKLESDMAGLSSHTREIIESKRLYVVENGFLKPRKGAEDWSRDLPRIISEYARSASQEIYMQPALKKIQAAEVALERSQRKYLQEWVKQWQGGEPAGTAAKVVAGARRLQNVSLMGASARTIALQFTGANNIFTESSGLGTDFLMSGIHAMRGMKPGSKLRNEVMEEGGFSGSFSGLLTSNKGIMSKASKAEKYLYAGISAADEHMRVWAYDMGKKQYAKNLGKNVKNLTADELAAAKRAGVEMANKTQFNMDSLNIPIKQGTQAGKFFTQIQQFNLKQTAYTGKLLFGNDADSMLRKEGGQIRFSKKGAERLTKFVAGYAAIIGTTTSAANAVFGEEMGQFMNFFGFEWEDQVPFGEQAIDAVDFMRGEKGISDIRVPTTPLLSFLRGGAYGDGLTDYVSVIDRYNRGEADEKEFQAAMSKLPGFLVRNLLPGGTQLNRTAEFTDTLSSGESTNATGSTRFLMHNRGALNILKGLVGGQYATEEGQEWLNNGMNTISAKHKVTLPDGSKVSVNTYARSLAPEEQAQYIGYYSTKQRVEKDLSDVGMRKTDTVGSIKERLYSGQISYQMALNEAEVWNNRVRNMYAPYLNGNERIPSRLVDDFSSNVLINLSTIQEEQRRMSAERMGSLQGQYEDDMGY